MYFLIKCVVSGILVALISEVSRRYTMAGAIIASLPITSILALIWLYKDTKSKAQVVALSNSIALIVLPSLVFFIFLSLLLTKVNINFYSTLALSGVGMVVTYLGYVWLLTKLGVQL